MWVGVGMTNRTVEDGGIRDVGYDVGFADSGRVVGVVPYLAVWATKMPRASPARMAERLRFGRKKDGGSV